MRADHTIREEEEEAAAAAAAAEYTSSIAALLPCILSFPLPQILPLPPVYIEALFSCLFALLHLNCD